MSLPYNELSESSLDAMIARERTRVVVPLTEWQMLTVQLRDEGLIRAGEAAQETQQPWTAMPVAAHTAPSAGSARVIRAPGWSRMWQWGARVAASVMLIGAGVLIGHGVIAGSQIARMMKVGGTHSGSTSVASEAFASPQEARQVLTTSQAAYQRAAAYLAVSDTTVPAAINPELYRERLAALDTVMSTTRRALKNAPQDPVLNQYYQSSLGARDATLQQITQTLPVGGRISHF